MNRLSRTKGKISLQEPTFNFVSINMTKNRLIVQSYQISCKKDIETHFNKQCLRISKPFRIEPKSIIENRTETSCERDNFTEMR